MEKLVREHIKNLQSSLAKVTALRDRAAKSGGVVNGYTVAQLAELVRQLNNQISRYNR